MRAFLVFFGLFVPLFGNVIPSVALERLMQGNQKYVSGKLDHPSRDIFRREEVAPGQEPFAVIVCCSDSRVPPEIIFDVGLGDVFVVRVAGNVVGRLGMESIQYAVDVLHAPMIIVLCHSNCGAVKAVMEGTIEDIPEIAKKIEPAIKSIESKKGRGAKPMLDEVIKNNVAIVRDQLKATPFLLRLAKEGKIMIVGGVYDLDDGKVSLLKN